jgi:hypothetical protein
MYTMYSKHKPPMLGEPHLQLSSYTNPPVTTLPSQQPVSLLHLQPPGRYEPNKENTPGVLAPLRWIYDSRHSDSLDLELQRTSLSEGRRNATFCLTRYPDARLPKHELHILQLRPWPR